MLIGLSGYATWDASLRLVLFVSLLGSAGENAHLGRAAAIAVVSGTAVFWVLMMLFAVFILGGRRLLARLHDLDKPDSYRWWFAIPFLNLYLAILLLFKKGTPGPNRFGDPVG
jgi:uncharacterized membrane protein YhaH (DUF805 family)